VILNIVLTVIVHETYALAMYTKFENRQCISTVLSLYNTAP